MTKSQLVGMYWETFRQDARMKLGQIQLEGIKTGGKQAKEIIEDLGRLADPFDPEDAGTLDKDDLRKLRSAFKTVI